MASTFLMHSASSVLVTTTTTIFLALASLVYTQMSALNDQIDLNWTPVHHDLYHYEHFAEAHTFREGDVLHFKFNPEHSNVLEVSPDAYKSCDNTTFYPTLLISGNDRVVLTKGRHFYITGFRENCEDGQKLALIVAPMMDQSIAEAASAPAPEAARETMLASPAPAPSPAMKSSSSAASFSATVFVIGVISAVACFFFV